MLSVVDQLLDCHNSYYQLGAVNQPSPTIKSIGAMNGNKNPFSSLNFFTLLVILYPPFYSVGNSIPTLGQWVSVTFEFVFVDNSWHLWPMTMTAQQA